MAAAGRVYPGLTARPWHDPAQFPWIAQLEAAAAGIYEECLALQPGERFRVNPLSAGLVTGAWREVRFFSEGLRNDANCNACPRTAAMLTAIPGATTAGLAYFSALDPGTHLHPHWGPHNARLRCHLGLVIPDHCHIRVGQETRSWEVGKAMVFDNSFEHEVWNEGDRTRLVLVVDVWHPDLSPSQIMAIHYSGLRAVNDAFDVAAEWRRTGRVSRLASTVASGGAETRA